MICKRMFYAKIYTFCTDVFDGDAHHLYLAVCLLSVAFEPGIDVPFMMHITNLLMCISYCLMIAIAYRHGQHINNAWLPLFVIIGALFDLVFVNVLFVPTLMNIVTLIIGTFKFSALQTPKTPSQPAPSDTPEQAPQGEFDLSQHTSPATTKSSEKAVAFS